jgi:carboxypeptidase Taq
LRAQYYAAALAAHPEIPSDIEQGQFDTLHAWVNDNIRRHGRKFNTPELTQRITGGSISIDPLVRYLKAKSTACKPS